MTDDDEGELSLFDAAAMAVGRMVGGGIFAVLESAASNPGNGAFISFGLDSGTGGPPPDLQRRERGRPAARGVRGVAQGPSGVRGGGACLAAAATLVTRMATEEPRTLWVIGGVSALLLILREIYTRSPSWS